MKTNLTAKQIDIINKKYKNGEIKWFNVASEIERLEKENKKEVDKVKTIEKTIKNYHKERL